jgi:hypothetical protein
MPSKPLKTFSTDFETIVAFDWDGLTSQPLEVAELAVKQALTRLEGSEETIFHSRMQVLRVARKMELWKLDLDPDVGEPFATEERWIKSLWPKSYRYAKDAWETEEALADLPMAELKEVTGANLKVLRQVSSGVRGKKAVLKAAREMTKDQLEEHLTSKYGQHIEPVRMMPKAGSEKFETAVEMVESVEECNRAEAIEKIADLIIGEYAAQYEHQEHTA